MAISKALKDAIRDAAHSIPAQNMFKQAIFPENEQVPGHRVGVESPDRPNAKEGRLSKVSISIRASLDHPFCQELKKYCDELNERHEAEISFSAGTTLIEFIPA